MSPAPNYVSDNGSRGTVPTTHPGAGNGPGTIIYLPIMPVSDAYERCENYRNRQSNLLGACLLILGVLCIVFNAVGIGFSSQAIHSEYLYLSAGIWSGILFITTGSLGISAGQTKTRCKIIGFMTTCILSACSTSVLLSFSVIGAVSVYPRSNNCDNTYYLYYSYNYYSSCSSNMDDGYRVVVAMQSLLAILAIIAAILAIWGAVICCRVICCCTPATTQRVVIPANYLSGNGQVMFINQPIGGPYVYNQAPPYSVGQGQIANPVGPPSYQASFAQPAWTQHQTIPPTLLYPSAPNYDGTERPPYPATPQITQGTEPPKY